MLHAAGLLGSVIRQSCASSESSGFPEFSERFLARIRDKRCLVSGFEYLREEGTTLADPILAFVEKWLLRKIQGLIGNPSIKLVLGKDPAGLGRHLRPQLITSIARLLLATHWFSRHVVLDSWFLHRNEPALNFQTQETLIAAEQRSY